MDMAKRIVLDAKTDYPAACNAVVLPDFLHFKETRLLFQLCRLLSIWLMDSLLPVICIGGFYLVN